MYVFKSLHGIAPVYLQYLLTVYKPTRSFAIRKFYENSDTTSENKVVMVFDDSTWQLLLFGTIFPVT